MTNDSMTVIQAVQQVGDADLLRQLAEVARAKWMALEVDGIVGATKGKHTPERTTCRNGSRDRPLHTRLGTLELRLPKLRQGTYFPSFLEPRRLRERALTAVIQAAWIGGMSTRKVDELVQAWGMTGISKSQVSELCGALDERVNDLSLPPPHRRVPLRLAGRHLAEGAPGRPRGVSGGHNRYRGEYGWPP